MVHQRSYWYVTLFQGVWEKRVPTSDGERHGKCLVPVATLRGRGLEGRMERIYTYKSSRMGNGKLWTLFISVGTQVQREEKHVEVDWVESIRV